MTDESEAAEEVLELNEIEQLFGKYGLTFKMNGETLEARVPLNLYKLDGPSLSVLSNTNDGTAYVRLVPDDPFEVDRTVDVKMLSAALDYDVEGNLVGIDFYGGGPQVG